MTENKENSTQEVKDSGTDTESMLNNPVVSALVAIIVICLVILVAVVIFTQGSGINKSQAENLTDGVRENRIQAVYLVNDRVYFGDLKSLGDGGLALEKSYFVRETPADPKTSTEAGSEIVSAAAEVGGDGTILLSPDQIVMVQNLAADSEISKLIDDARQ